MSKFKTRKAQHGKFSVWVLSQSGSVYDAGAWKRRFVWSRVLSGQTEQEAQAEAAKFSRTSASPKIRVLRDGDWSLLDVAEIR
jgi:hypothetical protein